jgi:hypothetical protein
VISRTRGGAKGCVIDVSGASPFPSLSKMISEGGARTDDSIKS